jgi:uncharacterized SAM-binding protein YcdF (DUF218 family)
MKGLGIDEPSGGGGAVRMRRSPIIRMLRALKLVTFSLILAAAVFAGGFAWFATHVGSMTTPADPERADAIIVLTGGQARVDAAVELLKSGKGERLLISGVHPSADRDDLQVATGGDEKLFACCVDIDHAALDTVGNAEESAKWVTSHGYHRVILVTNNYHMPRSLLEMERLIGDARFEPYPVVNTDLGDFRWISNREAMRVLFTEYLKYVAALAGVSPRLDDTMVANAAAAQ